MSPKRACTAVAAVLLLAGCAPASTAGPLWQAASPPASPAASGPAASGPAGSGTAAPSPAAGRTPKPRVLSDNKVRGPLGDVIDLGGLTDGFGDEYVIFGVTGGVVNETSDFGFAIGVRQPGNAVTEDLTISEYRGSADAPGFHPMQAQMELDGHTVQPAFGYYSGTPASITVHEGARTLTAHLARWSEQPATTVFWFDPADVHHPDQWSDLGAYDAAGARLPDGHIELQTY
ncbi:hypothetical protein [Actinoplanes sp. N902-109]|uniref:hypothetical protein n=1 Tax=Actinoplanes sp. (strain N902-109) TaxID=649831 RepID=UPI0003295084|nr:hypothetical protein [Actinoplanes sp. N902-109]AGL17831.1 hypothetical protein L083_4321 [Actinoplanes sp. N902-109]